jgi:hypothetical protein
LTDGRLRVPIEGQFSTRQHYAIGIYMGLSLIENQAIGAEFDDEILNALRGYPEAGVGEDDRRRAMTALSRGFKSIVPIEVLNFIGNDVFRRIFLGEPVSSVDMFEFVVDDLTTVHAIASSEVWVTFIIRILLIKRSHFVKCIGERVAGFSALPAGIFGPIRVSIDLASEITSGIYNGYLRIPARFFWENPGFDRIESDVGNWLNALCL